MSTITFDIESNGLLDESTVNYCTSPYKIKDSFQVHCIVVENQETEEIVAFYDGPTYIFDGRKHVETIDDVLYVLEKYAPVVFTHEPMDKFEEYIKTHVAKVVGHNIINFDLLAMKLYCGMDYTVQPDSWCGKDVEIVDTLVISKTLNPDRFGGHSLESWGERTGQKKLDFRPHILKEKRFIHFAADMLYYCIMDVKANTVAYKAMLEEAGTWKWKQAFDLEHAVADIITRQSHRGFKFNKVLALMNVKELDGLMEERRKKIEPLLPPKQATKKIMHDTTPPKLQFKKDGTLSASILKFAGKMGAEVIEKDYVYYFSYNGVDMVLPLKEAPLVTETPATIDDTTHIKGWLVSLGWNPSEFAEKDLSVKSGTKIKRTQQEIEEAIDKYVEQTLSSPFRDVRCEILETTPWKLKARLNRYKEGRAIKVPSNPKFTKGQEKEICPNLERIYDAFPFAKDIVEYLTYRHRRNSILGGGKSWDEEEEEDFTGYLANVREDGRIPTPADTCGASTSRFKHKLVANIPRVTSLYGEQMRAMFGVDEGFYQIGYDFDSLEAREEASYCWRYDEDKEYCKSLTEEKPNDVHTKMAEKISAIIDKEFKRGPAKSVKYGATYGAQAAKIAKTIGSDLETGQVVFDAFWEAAMPLNMLKQNLAKYWETTGGKKFILGIDGRKVPTRSAHAILNSLFQSAGVICAKKAMVIHDRLLKENNLSVDFFVEDWQNMAFCQQMIAYHDESQLEISKALVEFKKFSSEEEAKTFKDQDKTWSEVIHSDRGWFRAYCRAGELATQAVLEAGKFYNLNVDLTAGYIIGRNWKECH